MRAMTRLTIALLLGASASAAFAQAAPSAADVAQVTDILKKSIAFPTVEGRGQVPAYAAYLASVLKAGGFADSEISITPVGETATLVVTFPGKRADKPIVLMGHMDVVEANPADWTRDPFVAVEEGGYIYGRGSEDNKFDVSVIVATLAQMRKAGFKPGRKLILALSGDEETHMATTKLLAGQLKGAELALNGDGGGGLLSADGQPVYYGLQAGEKTYADFAITVTDPGGHSSAPTGSNAIYRLGKALARLDAYHFPPQINELTKASLEAAAREVGGDLGGAMARFAADPTDAAAADRISQEPEYIGQVRTTCVATMVNGGHAQNALPQRATANINCRIFPGVTIPSIRDTLVRVIADDSATVTILDDPTSSDASPLRPDVVKAVNRAVHARYPKLQVSPNMSAGATDGLHFRALGVPTYGVSSLFQRAEDGFAHGLNERIPVNGIAPALAHWRSLLTDLAK